MNNMQMAEVLYETIGNQWPEGKCGHEWSDLTEEEKLGWWSVALNFLEKVKR